MLLKDPLEFVFYTVWTEGLAVNMMDIQRKDAVPSPSGKEAPVSSHSSGLGKGKRVLRGTRSNSTILQMGKLRQRG